MSRHATLPRWVRRGQRTASAGRIGFGGTGERRGAVLVLPALALLLVTVALIAAGVGAVAISPGEIAAILARPLGISLPWRATEQQASVLLAIRLPRVVLGALIGAALAVSGAAMQGLFRNPLADPGLVGVSSGAALAAVSVIVLGATLWKGAAGVLASWTLPTVAFAGSMATTLLVYRLATVNGGVTVATMLLAGIAVNALVGALTGLLTFAATDAQLSSITFWSMGSLGGATWEAVGAAAPFLVAGLLLLPRAGRSLNALLLGEAEAGHLGVEVERVKRQVVLVVALAVGAAVSVAGIIGFVGLVVPHLLRLMVGPDHRRLLPGAALLGGSLLLSADLLARTLLAPAELPLGIVTALAGTPFFLWLLLRDRCIGGL